MNNQIAVIGLMAVLLTLFLVIPGARAADLSVGGGIGFKPDYEGSEDYEAVPVPFANFNFNQGMYIKLLGSNLRFNLIPEKTSSLGPVYNYRAKRSDLENDTVDLHDGPICPRGGPGDLRRDQTVCAHAVFHCDQVCHHDCDQNV